MLRNAWTDAWEDPAGPGPLGMPLQNILTAEANARIARAHRKDLVFAPVGQIVGSMNEVQAGARRDVPTSSRSTSRSPSASARASTTPPDPAFLALPRFGVAGHRIAMPHNAKTGGRGVAGRVAGGRPHRGDRRGVRGQAARATRARRSTKVERAGGDPLRRWSAATPDAPVDGTGAAVRVPARPHRRAIVARRRRTAVVRRARRLPTSCSSATTRAVLAGRDQPGASVVTISLFGGDGPLAGMPGDEFTLQAWCGLMSGCGTPETPPLQMGIGARALGHRRDGGAGARSPARSVARAHRRARPTSRSPRSR